VIIVVDADSAAVSLEDPENFRAFLVRALGADTSAPKLASAIGGLGLVTDDGGHIYIEPAALTGLAGGLGRSVGWQASLLAMIGFAAKSGWVDDAGRVRAHVERDAAN
jgi:hypothetical protein